MNFVEIGGWLKESSQVNTPTEGFLDVFGWVIQIYWNQPQDAGEHLKEK